MAETSERVRVACTRRHRAARRTSAASARYGTRRGPWKRTGYGKAAAVADAESSLAN